MFLDRQFTFVHTLKQQMLASVGISLFVLLFIATFQPFGINTIKDGKSLIIVGYSIITLLVLVSYIFIFRFFFSDYYNPKYWTIRKMLIYVLINTFTIALGNCYYSSILAPFFSQNLDLLDFFLFTLAIGFFPFTIFVLLIDKMTRQSQESNSKKNKSNNKSSGNQPLKKLVVLSSTNSNEKMVVSLDQLICLKSEGNYVKVFYLNNEQVSSNLLRNSLSNISEPLLDKENFHKCHRSFFVNFSFVKKVEGNARNYSLLIDELDFLIPVSRNFSKKIIQELV